MKIRYSEIRKNTDGEAPFNGVVLQAKEDGVKGYSQSVRKLTRKIVDGNNEGIVFHGDWTKQALEFIEILKQAEKFAMEILIYTEHDLETFKILIGQTCYEKANKIKLDDEQMELNRGMLSLIGGMMVDYYIPNDYMVICGTGEDRTVCKIKKIIEDDEFFVEEVDNG